MHPEGLKISCVQYCEGSDNFILWDINKNKAELLKDRSHCDDNGNDFIADLFIRSG